VALRRAQQQFVAREAKLGWHGRAQADVVGVASEVGRLGSCGRTSGLSRTERQDSFPNFPCSFKNSALSVSKCCDRAAATNSIATATAAIRVDTLS
jgi:hypothetical protein